MIAILGSGGSVANGLVQLLSRDNHAFRLVSRSGRTQPGATETVRADLSDRDQAIQAVAGCDAAYLVAGLKYDHKVWAEVWPRIMANTIEACKRAGTRLIFLDNVYMYGRVNGVMTEETPFNPASRKGEIRARIANALMREWQSGGLTAMIARAADFYGPETPSGIPNAMVFTPLSLGKKASWLVNDAVPHSFTFTPDIAQALLKLAATESAWNQTWHLPTSPKPPTGREFIAMAAETLGIAPRYRVLSKPMVRIFGWFQPVVGEVHEMLYQNDSPYLFDSSKYAAAMGFSGTAYDEGIRITAESFRRI
ncbi:MAG: NAD-dependent epimerase/dehydratase family protein [Acidobacteriaceae bacterium]